MLNQIAFTHILALVWMGQWSGNKYRSPSVYSYCATKFWSQGPHFWPLWLVPRIKLVWLLGLAAGTNIPPNWSIYTRKDESLWQVPATTPLMCARIKNLMKPLQDESLINNSGENNGRDLKADMNTVNHPAITHAHYYGQNSDPKSIEVWLKMTLGIMDSRYYGHKMTSRRCPL